MKHNKKRNAFTLMELMIVIVILGILASLVLPNLLGKSDEAKKKLVCVQMKGISESLKMFKLDNNTFPSTEEGLQALISNPDEELYPSYSASAYMESKNLPKDSWKRKFIYTKTQNGFELLSLGADGKEGGEGLDSDIYFSKCKF